MKFEFVPRGRSVSDVELLDDLRRVAAGTGIQSITCHEYRHAGSFSPETVRRRFGTWNHALEQAGLTVKKRWRVPEQELLDNVEDVWRGLGRQPTREDMEREPSRFSGSVYEYRFGTWNAALEVFAVHRSKARQD